MRPRSDTWLWHWETPPGSPVRYLGLKFQKTEYFYILSGVIYQNLVVWTFDGDAMTHRKLHFLLFPSLFHPLSTFLAWIIMLIPSRCWPSDTTIPCVFVSWLFEIRVIFPPFLFISFYQHRLLDKLLFYPQAHSVYIIIYLGICFLIFWKLFPLTPVLFCYFPEFSEHWVSGPALGLGSSFSFFTLWLDIISKFRL